MHQTDELAQQIIDLRNQHTALEVRRNHALEEIKDLKEAYEKAKAEARKLFGTDDPEELERQITQLEKEIKAEMAEYQKALQEADKALEAIEKAVKESRVTA